MNQTQHRGVSPAGLTEGVSEHEKLPRGKGRRSGQVWAMDPFYLKVLAHTTSPLGSRAVGTFLLGESKRKEQGIYKKPKQGQI